MVSLFFKLSVVHLFGKSPLPRWFLKACKDGWWVTVDLGFSKLWFDRRSPREKPDHLKFTVLSYRLQPCKWIIDKDYDILILENDPAFRMILFILFPRFSSFFCIAFRGPINLSLISFPKTVILFRWQHWRPTSLGKMKVVLSVRASMFESKGSERLQYPKNPKHVLDTQLLIFYCGESFLQFHISTRIFKMCLTRGKFLHLTARHSDTFFDSNRFRITLVRALCFETNRAQQQSPQERCASFNFGHWIKMDRVYQFNGGNRRYTIWWYSSLCQRGFMHNTMVMSRIQEYTD